LSLAAARSKCLRAASSLLRSKISAISPHGAAVHNMLVGDAKIDSREVARAGIPKVAGLGGPGRVDPVAEDRELLDGAPLDRVAVAAEPVVEGPVGATHPTP
jgi:hypothetical protein